VSDATRPVTVRLAPVTIAELDAQARAAGLSRAAYLTRLIAAAQPR